jgi:hypothetical protein
MLYSIDYASLFVKRKKEDMMTFFIETMLESMRPAFSRSAAFAWFVAAFAGFAIRSDDLGVSSIVRALMLAPSCYPCLVHFFHSSAWTAEALLYHWWLFLAKTGAPLMILGRIVLMGDHTKVPKDGRKIPEVATLHQDSETSSKPSFFRGHHWGFVGLLMRAQLRFFCAPLWAQIHTDSPEDSRATRIVSQAAKIATAMGQRAYLVLDAFFSTGPVFMAAAKYDGQARPGSGGQVHILTRAKKNIVAFLKPTPPKMKRRGRPRIYGKKLKLMTLFDKWTHKFDTAQAVVYQKNETIRFLTLDLFWKPVKGIVRFFLIETSRGRIILMTSDSTMQAMDALFLYCRRFSIETLFDSIKNILGGMRYHFWSRYLQPSSRRAYRKTKNIPISSQPEKTLNTLAAIEKFLAIQILVLGAIQLLAARFASKIHEEAHCWIRTPCGEIPSAFVTRTALVNLIRKNLFILGKDLITRIILSKKSSNEKHAGFTGHSEMVA